LEDCSNLSNVAFDFTIRLFKYVGEKCKLGEKENK